MEHKIASFLAENLPAWALKYFAMLTAEQFSMILKGLAISLVVIGLLATIYGVFKALGWRRYQGRWVSPEQFQVIVQELYNGVRSGRVPDYETMKILDEYVYGKEGSRIRNLTKADHI